MITASHNPKQDNGYKLYWENGAQIIPPHDKNIQKSIEENLELKDLTGYFDYSSNKICPDKSTTSPNFTSDSIASYIAAIKSQFTLNPSSLNESCPVITYTAMHGVGYNFITQALASLKFPALNLTESQIYPDPEFPTVAFPNPEEGKGALKLAMEAAEQAGSRFILANDPDADRLAIAELDQNNNGWKIFVGDEIGAILAMYFIEIYKEKDIDLSKIAM